MNLSETIKKFALDSGFDLVGIAPAESFQDYRWKDSVMRDPKLTIPDARSLLIVGFFDLKRLKENHEIGSKGKIARSYAAGHEFNLVYELFPIKQLLAKEGYHYHVSPGSVAGSTIPMKLLAVRAGLGRQGKHSVIITPEYGSWISFGALMTDALLEYDEPLEDDICDKCTACIDACPTGAIVEPYIVDMKMCLDARLNSSGDFPDDIKEKIGNRVLSCDTCLEVCPYSKKILQKYKLQGKTPYEYHLLELLTIDEKSFRDMSSTLNWSISFESFKRNVIITVGNSGDWSLAGELEKHTTHDSEIVRNTSQWALDKLKKASNELI